MLGPLLLEVGNGLLVVPLRVGGRDAIELAVIGERRLGPGLHDDLVGLFEVGAVAFLILDRGAHGPAQDLGLARLVATTDAELQSAARDHVEHRCRFGHTNRMPPGQDVGHLSEADSRSQRCDGGLGLQWCRRQLCAFRLEVMLGHEPVVEAQLVGEHALSHLVGDDATA